MVVTIKTITDFVTLVKRALDHHTTPLMTVTDKAIIPITDDCDSN